MGARRLLLAFVTLAVTVGIFGVVPWGNGPEDACAATERNQSVVLDHVRPVLRSAGLSAVVYYRGACRGRSHDLVPFPAVKLRNPSTGGAGLPAVREIFRDDRGVVVTQAQPGVIRIRVGEVPDQILRTKISHLALGPAGQYDATSALYELLSAADFRAALRRNQFQALPVYPPLVNLVNLPGAAVPHLPRVMKELTVDDILQSVAKTFKGVVLFGGCERPRLLSIDFVLVADHGGWRRH